MKRLLSLGTVIGLATMLVVAEPASAVNAEPMGAEDGMAAKVARARAKAAGTGQVTRQGATGTPDGSGGPGTSPCGVNIGNSFNTVPGKGPKEIIVVVQGDVVNANNNCKK